MKASKMEITTLTLVVVLLLNHINRKIFKKTVYFIIVNLNFVNGNLSLLQLAHVCSDFQIKLGKCFFFQI